MEGLRKLHNAKLHTSYFPPSIWVETWRVSWQLYRPRPRHRWKNNIRMYLR